MAKRQGVRTSRKNQAVMLILLYLGCAGIRYLLCLLTSEYPSVGIDEFLYYSLGRSIANSGSLLYRAQPAQYPYFLYPMVLSPVYALFPAGSDFYRLLQLWNSLLMNAAVFPIYGICRKLFTDPGKAVGITAVSMLLPDFMLGGFIFSEVLIYPLFFGLFYEIISIIYEKKQRSFIWTGILGACLYFTKPGAVVPAVTALLLFCLESFFRKDRKERAGALLGTGAMAAAFAVLWAILRFFLGYTGSVLGVYDMQLETADGLNLDRFIQTAALYPYYFTLAGGIIPAAVVLTRRRGWRQENKRWLTIGSISLGIVMLGTAWLINRREDTNILFLRYMDMYLPLGLMACFLPYEEAVDRNERKYNTIPAILLLAYTVICTAVAGSTAGVGQKVGDHFQLGTAMLCMDNVKGIADVLIYALCALGICCILKENWKKLTIRIVCGAIACLIMAANISGYTINKGNANHTVGEEGRNTKEMVGENDYLYIFTNDKLVGDGGLNVYSKHNVSWITMNDLFNHLYPDGGIYQPFVPASARGMTAENLTPDVEQIVFDDTAYPLVKFSENARVTFSPGSRYCVVQFEKGKRIADSIMGNVFVHSLDVNTPGVLIVFKEEWLNEPIQLTFDIESPVDQTMTFLSDKFKYQIPLVQGRNHYAFKIAGPAEAYNISVETEQIQVHGYEIKTGVAE